MMHHPLKPTLYDNEVVSMAYDRWDRAHIWLHKQPLFMWQISLSFLLFGVSEFTVRLPDIVLCSLMTLVIFRTASLLVSRNVGLISAMLFLSSFYIIELVSGREIADHNDVSFLAYVTFSLWALVEYEFSGKKRWIVLIGLFSGCAILCKWLVGLTVYGCWMLLKAQKKSFGLRQQKDIVVALGITLLVALPWQLLSFYWYPVEAKHELVYNARHFSEVIEGHAGNRWFHVDAFPELYGTLAPFLLLFGGYFLLKKTTNRKLAFSLVGIFLFVYLFFSIAETKMKSFTLPVFMIGIIMLAAAIDEAFNWIKNGRFHPWIVGGLLVVFAVVRLDFSELKVRHAANESSKKLIANKTFFQQTNLGENSLLFNLKGRQYVEAMFYSESQAYNFIPDSNEIARLQQLNYTIGIVFDPDEIIPGYIKSFPEIVVYRKRLHVFD